MSGLITKIALFFGSSFIWGLAFVRIKLPPLLGYIVSGILLGPSLSRLMGRVEQVGMIGEIGLVMLMFLAGLELDIDEFTSEKNDPSKPLKTVFLQILLSFGITILLWILPSKYFENSLIGLGTIVILVLVVGLCSYLITSIGKKYNISKRNLTKGAMLIISGTILILAAFIGRGKIRTNHLFNLQTMILVGCLLSLNSSAVVIKLLENRDKKNTQAGTNVIGILIAQDMALIGMLIALRSVTEGISWTSLAMKVSVAIGLLWMVKALTDSRPSFLSESLDYIFEKGKELAAVFAIMLCFIFSAFAEWVGLSDIYGAFIAGLLLGNVYKHSDVIIEMCEPISNIFMTIFFMWIGAMFDIQKLETTWPLITVITIGTILFKYFSNFLIIDFVNSKNLEASTPFGSGLSRSCIILCSVLLTQMSEFSIVMINIVQNSLKGQNELFLCEILKAATIVSLSIGSVITVFLKNMMYRVKYIK